MRRLSLLAVAVSSCLVGCQPPADEVVPKPKPKATTSVTTDDAAAEPKPDATPGAETPAVTPPVAEAPAATPPAAEAPAAAAPTTESPAPATPAAETPAPTTPPAETAPTTPPSNPGASTGSGSAVRFVADKKLQVPGMSCPYGCYPTVEKTLAKLPGVQGVQLAKQPEGTAEGDIALKVVELKLGEGFDLDAALAALKKVNFEATEVN